MKNAYFLILSMMFLTACEKEIVLDLDESENKYVIEGVISNGSNIQTIKISKSVDFYDDSDYPSVSNAIVTVQENDEIPIIFSETSPGIYQAINFTGVEGNTYSLSVTIDGKEYTASSTMPNQVDLVDLTYEENAFSPPGEETSYVVTPNFVDPSNEVNYYRFNLFINGIKDEGFFTLNDDLINGEVNSFGLRSSDSDNAINLNDIITIEMFGIDENIYNYFYVLEQNSDSQNTPNNPKSNISKNVLGYFSAQNKQFRTIIIQ